MSEEKKHNQPIDDSRREFLRKSVYAAYATPVITALLVSKASALVSTGANKGQCQNSGGTWVGNGPNGYCIWP
jgi:hypothetical protein